MSKRIEDWQLWLVTNGYVVGWSAQGALIVGAPMIRCANCGVPIFLPTLLMSGEIEHDEVSTGEDGCDEPALPEVPSHG